jgi:4-hydroxythreonine-4-phosphate dehydrogenase
MTRILIVADDLSGAGDSGVAAAAAGWKTLVVLGVPSNLDQAEVLSVDADTRRLPPGEAALKTAEIVRACYRPGQMLFKKLDSTLRGNVGAELRAVLETITAGNGAEAEPPVAIVAPAFPATGRTTRNGIQLLNGIPLEETGIWRREGIAGRSHIPEMLHASGLRAAQVNLEAIRSGKARLSAAMRELAVGHHALVCDAETDEDLRSIVTSSMSIGSSTVWAGSAGLARCLFPLRDSQLTRKLPAIRGPILFVIGSAATLCRRQVQALASDPDVASVTVSPAILRAGPHADAWQEYNARLSEALAAGRDAVLLLGDEDGVRLEDGQQLCVSLARLVVLQAKTIGALVLTGGETARAVLQALQVEALSLIGELEPGVVASVAQGSSVPVITKAGAFGDDDTLRRCRMALRDAASRGEAR